MSNAVKKANRADQAASKHPAKQRTAQKKSSSGAAEQSERGAARRSLTPKSGKPGERSNFKKSAKSSSTKGDGAAGQVWARGKAKSAPSSKSSFNKPPTAKLKAAGKNNTRTPKKK
ncbi:hypothetical protein [Streptomyces sp. NBC_00470]|uniref:hypothetical protein n=1 Tax=Streptomyces sp. NBC_00470 TaxID=2975753 RepID=UPI0030E1092A